MTARRTFKEGLRKNNICSKVCVGDWAGANGKSSAKESSDQGVGKYKDPIVAPGVEVSTEWIKDFRKLVVRAKEPAARAAMQVGGGQDPLEYPYRNVWNSHCPHTERINVPGTFTNRISGTPSDNPMC